MGDPDRFRFPGGSGGEDQVGGIVGPTAGSVARSASFPPWRLRSCCRLDEVGVDDDAGARALQQLLPPLPRIGRIDGHVRAAGPQHSDDRHDEIDGATDGDGHRFAPVHPLVDQMPGKVGGSPSEVGPAERSITADDRR